ncbi:MAG: hypothetical protein GYB33_02490 [Gammaproteobacteria bacterium]|nr:hypothetical protein [Gammaproteobacteria bacterium]
MTKAASAVAANLGNHPIELLTLAEHNMLSRKDQGVELMPQLKQYSSHPAEQEPSHQRDTQLHQGRHSSAANSDGINRANQKLDRLINVFWQAPDRDRERRIRQQAIASVYGEAAARDDAATDCS